MAGRNLISNSRKIIQLVFSVMPVNVKVVHFVAEEYDGYPESVQSFDLFP